MTRFLRSPFLPSPATAHRGVLPRGWPGSVLTFRFKMSSRALKQPLGPYTGSVPLCRGCHISISCSHFSSRCARMLRGTRARCGRGQLQCRSQAASRATSHTFTTTHPWQPMWDYWKWIHLRASKHFQPDPWFGCLSLLLICYDTPWKPRFLNRWVNRLISTWLHENDLWSSLNVASMSYIQVSPTHKLDAILPDLLIHTLPKNYLWSHNKVHTPSQAQVRLVQVFSASTEINSLLTAPSNMPLLPSLLPPQTYFLFIYPCPAHLSRSFQKVPAHPESFHKALVHTIPLSPFSKYSWQLLSVLLSCVWLPCCFLLYYYPMLALLFKCSHSGSKTRLQCCSNYKDLFVDYYTWCGYTRMQREVKYNSLPWKGSQLTRR